MASLNIRKMRAKSISYGGTRGLNSVRFTVIHYTGNKGDTAAGNGNYFMNGNTRSAGAHFFVDSKEVIESIPMEYIAYAVGGDHRSGHDGGAKYYGVCTNANSVSIELCDIADKQPTDKQIELTAKLIAYIQSRCPNAKTIIRHYDVNGKSCLPVETTELLTPKGWKRLIDINKGDTVCAYKPETDTLVFSEVQDVVKPHTDLILENRHVMATADHRMYLKPSCANSSEFREVKWEDALTGTRLLIIKNGAEIEAPGLNLTDDELRLLVWIQGDGHYMHDDNRGIYGIEFHLKKQRKISRILSILSDMEISTSLSRCQNGSVHIRIYDKSLVDWAENWLTNKNFDYGFLDMSKEQFDVFREEIVQVDGHKGGRAELYTSIHPQNLDIVQTLCSLHGVRSIITKLGADYKCAVSFAHANYTVGCNTYIATPVKTYKAVVSCVTVESGYILIRQNRRTFIVGNCPATMIDNSKWNSFLSKLKAKGITSVNVSTSGESGSNKNIKTGQEWSVKYTKHQIKCDGIRGPKTREQAVRVLQHALNKKYKAGLAEDGDWGPKTEKAMGSHSCKLGDESNLVLAAKIMLKMKGKSGMRYDKIFGSGTKKAAGKEKITAKDFKSYTK